MKISDKAIEEHLYPIDFIIVIILGIIIIHRIVIYFNAKGKNLNPYFIKITRSVNQIKVYT